MYIESGQLDLAEGLLGQMSHGFEWNSPEAWLEYGKPKQIGNNFLTPLDALL